EKTVRTNKGAITLFAKYIDKRTGSFIIELSWKPESNSFAEILHHAGVIPLPPYIKRNAEAADAERYQTVYADQDGSVAAPTAGLHFTEKIFSDLLEKKIETHFVTLHVGAGTFKPVKSETMQDHEMHAEWIDVSKKTIENILINLDKNIIAVGTTSLRTLESLYWLGVKSRESGVGSRKSEVGSLPIGQAGQESIQLLQWDAYNLSEFNVTVPDALQALLHWMNKNNLDRLVAKTQLLITPGYEFKIVKGLITNFHQPQSTLLLLVAALIGNSLPNGQASWRDVYEYALNNDFRFLSYGDGCLLWHPSASLPDDSQYDKI
ncbi:MAG: S-adenosylmethionine:tRNA ribosyltransferase-isomerase, partial [Chitinophagaceae bacterium]